MKKLLPIIIVVIVAAIAGFYLLGPGRTGGEFVGSLTDALRMGRAQKCTWENASTGETDTFWMKDENTIYAEIQGEEGTGYLLAKDNCIYSWEGSEGIKMCFTPTEGKEKLSFEDLAAESEVSLEEEGVEYHCQATSGGSRFDVPDGVEFMDFSLEE